MEQTSQYEIAESFRKGKNYSEAINIFSILWEQSGTQLIGWRYAFCLRKLERLDEAESIGRSAISKYPNDRFTRSELGWILYDKEIKPAKEESDLGRAVHYANEILMLNSDALARNLVSSAVMKIAKSKKKWNVVLEWAEKVNANELSSVPREINRKHTMSDKEIWFVGKARALLELEHYSDARTLAQEGLIEFPNEVFLIRIAALAFSKSGHIDEAIIELEKLISSPRAGWYVKADLADLYKIKGKNKEAYRLLCEAAENSQEDEFKLTCFYKIGQIAFDLGQYSIAMEHVALAKAVRISNDWSIPNELLLLEKNIQSTMITKGQASINLPTDVNKLSIICHARWKTGKIEGLEFLSGILGPISSEKPYTFIKRDNGGENVFVIIKNIPNNCKFEGAHLEFTLMKSFDKKKNRESVQAANIRLL